MYNISHDFYILKQLLPPVEEMSTPLNGYPAVSGYYDSYSSRIFDKNNKLKREMEYKVKKSRIFVVYSTLMTIFIALIYFLFVWTDQ